MTWSRHSRRRVPMTRSATAFARGARTGASRVSRPSAAAALQAAGVAPATAPAVLEGNERARLDGLRAALARLALLAVVALFFTRPIPRQQPGAPAPADGPA